ncbi:MAG TPA: hypothetical protein VK092_04675, partial [Deinococcales bacterium]|nr:hypothetical protein [Deinococcales bacterium]
AELPGPYHPSMHRPTGPAELGQHHERRLTIGRDERLLHDVTVNNTTVCPHASLLQLVCLAG